MADPATDTFGGLDLDTVVRGALPQSNVDAPKIQKSFTDIGKQEEKEKGALTDRMVSGIERDKTIVDKTRQGIEPVPDQKWDADAERKKYTTDPMEQFGSLGFIAVTLASAFTRQPMINALTAAGSFMDAANKKNDKDYDRAYEAFKENAALAMKRHEMQREAFDDAMKMMNSDVSAGKAELAAVADKFGDKRAQALLEGGYIKELIDYQNSQREAYAGILRQMPQIEAMDLKRKQLALDPDYQSSDPQRQARAELRVSEANNLSPEQQIWAKHVREHPDESSEDSAKFYQNLKMFGARSTIDSQRRKEIYDREIEDWKQRNPGKEVPLDVMTHANLSAMGKVGQTFDQSALDDMADIYMDGNKSVLTNIARGVQGPENIAKFWQTVSRKMVEKNMSAEDINRAQQDFAGAMAGARTLSTREKQLQLAGNEAELLVPRVKSISDRIDRTKFPTLNSLILAAEKGTGGEDVIRFGVAVNALIPVYARVLKPTGVLTEGDTQRASHILDQAWSKGQINAALDQMMIEIDSAKKGLEKTKNEHRPQPQATPQQSSSPVIIEYDAQGNRVSR